MTYLSQNNPSQSI